MEYTDNLELVKRDYNDTVDIMVESENLDKIDEAIGELEENKANVADVASATHDHNGTNVDFNSAKVNGYEVLTTQGGQILGDTTSDSLDVIIIPRGKASSGTRNIKFTTEVEGVPAYSIYVNNSSGNFGIQNHATSRQVLYYSVAGAEVKMRYPLVLDADAPYLHLQNSTNANSHLKFTTSSNQNLNLRHEISDANLPNGSSDYQALVIEDNSTGSHPPCLVVENNIYAKGNKEVYHKGNIRIVASEPSTYEKDVIYFIKK